MGIDAALNVLSDGIKDGAFPGAVFCCFKNGQLETRTLGRVTYCPESSPMTADKIFDLASVSKVVGTTSMAIRLAAAGALDLDQPVVHHLPEFAAAGKSHITVRNLLRHDSGLIAFRPYHRSHTEAKTVLESISNEGLTYATGTKTVYSDLNMIVLQRVMETISAAPMDLWLRRNVFGPLRMPDTHYRENREPDDDLTRYVPTERIEPWRIELRVKRGTFVRPRYGKDNEGEYIQGEVHDPTATVLGGMAGHAGLFSTVGDLARFAIAMFEGQLVDQETLRTWTKRQEAKSSRALGWDTRSENSSSGTRMSDLSFGHTGYTGTSIWIDPVEEKFAVLLTNRVHPTSDNTKIIPLRARFHDALWE